MAEYPNWFEQIARYNFEEFLLPLKGKPKLKFLQLGCFTGDASVWLLDNVLTGEDCKLFDVDTWMGALNEPIQEAMDFADVFNTYLDRVGGTTRWFRQTTFEYLTSTIHCVASDYQRPYRYDFVYVDAHHTAASALLDCELSWPWLKDGGLLAIDDYEWQHPDGNPIHAPKLGIEMFLDRHEGEYELLAKNSQVWLRKL